KTAKLFLGHIEDMLKELDTNWSVVEVIGFTSDASGESWKARILLLKKYPHLIILDCYAHQINLIVGNYLESKSTLLKVTNRADQLTAWLHRCTLVLSCIQERQLAKGQKAASVLHPVKMRWMSHYIAYARVLYLGPTLRAIIADNEANGPGHPTFLSGIKKPDARKQARNMIQILKDGQFWHDLSRVKLYLEPLAIAANIAQSAHCRLDQVLLTFGFLYSRFTTLCAEMGDTIGVDAILASIEKQWAKSDQAVFVLAAVLNPFNMLQPFQLSRPEFIGLKLKELVVALWKCLFRACQAPSTLIGTLGFSLTILKCAIKTVKDGKRP
ncbi:hypothetical protein C8T65DRAFT_578734, partial [Cerioporus squamosus]